MFESRMSMLVCEKKVRTSDWLRVMQFAMHRCDLDTQFMNLGAERATHSKKRDLQKKEAKRLRRPQALPVYHAATVTSSSVSSVITSEALLMPAAFTVRPALRMGLRLPISLLRWRL